MCVCVVVWPTSLGRCQYTVLEVYCVDILDRDVMSYDVFWCCFLPPSLKVGVYC